MRVEKIPVQTLASHDQLSSTLMQLVFAFDQDMSFEKTLIQTLASTPRPSEAGGLGGLEPPPIISVCIRQSKTLRLEKCEPNSDSLKKIKEPRLALSTLLAHILQAISD